MAQEPNANRPYTVQDLREAVHELDFAKSLLEEVRRTLKRHRDAIKSFEKEEKDAEANVHSKEVLVKKIASNIEK